MLLDSVVLLLHDDLGAVWGLGIGEFHHVVTGLHRRHSDFIHSVVVHRRDDAIRVWRNWIREDPLVHPYQLAYDLIWCRLLPFFSVSPISRLVVLECLLTLPGLMRNSERLGFPTFVVLGKGRPALKNSIMRLKDGCHFYLRFLCPRLTGRMLADVVQRKSATAGSLDGSVWRELEGVCLFLGMMSWLVFLPMVEDFGVWSDGLLDAYIAMIPKTDGDAIPLGQTASSVCSLLFTACLGICS